MLVSTRDGPPTPHTQVKAACQCDLILPMMTKQGGLSREQVFPFLEDGPFQQHISMTVCLSKGTASALSHARAVSRLPIHPRSSAGASALQELLQEDTQLLVC